MNQKKMLISDKPKGLVAVYDWPTLFRVDGAGQQWLWYEIDETDFSEGWLVCQLDPEDIAPLERGEIEVRSVFNNHRHQSSILYRTFSTGQFQRGDTVWPIWNDMVWERRLLPKADWFIQQRSIKRFDSDQNIH